MIMLMAMMLAGQGYGAPQRAPNPFDPNKVTRGINEFPAMAAGALFDDADTNHDGYLTRSELDQAAARRMIPFGPDPRGWMRFDANHDGVVTKAEVLAGVARMQAAVKAGRSPY